MPVLMLVMAFLMAIGLMTYARIDSYRNFVATKAHFEQFMSAQEREFYSKVADKSYTDTVEQLRETLKKSKQPDPDLDKQPKADGVSKLSIKPIFQKKIREEQYDRYHRHLQAFVSLINHLYSNYRFFDQIRQSRPNLVEDLINAMIRASNKQEGGLENIKEISGWDLEDSQLNELLYFMLRGSGTKNGPAKKKPFSGGANLEEGYPSLLDFLADKDPDKLRLYLAPRELLYVVTGGDDNAVENIIRVRNEIYKEVKNKNIKAENGTEDFERLFKGTIAPLYSNFIDFTVSKTDPSKY